MVRPRPRLTLMMGLARLLLGPVLVAFVWALIAVGASTVTILVMVAAFALGRLLLNDKLTLAARRARVTTPQEAPELHAMVEHLSRLAGLPKPKIAVADRDIPDAFALGRGPKSATLGVTTGLMANVEPRELETILAHELVHIANRDEFEITMADCLAMVAGLLIRWGAGQWDVGRGMTALLLVWVVLSRVLRDALSRHNEFAADRGGAIITAAPATMASALRRTYGDMARIPTQDTRAAPAPNACCVVPAAARDFSLSSLFGTHPPTEVRVARLLEMRAESDRDPSVDVTRRGESEGRRPDPHGVFGLSAALTVLTAWLAYTPGRVAGVCFRPVDAAAFAAASRDAEGLLAVGERTGGTAYRQVDDEYSFRWVVVEDDDFTDLVTTIHAVCQTFVEAGVADKLLCAVFPFLADGHDGPPVHFVYGYARGAFYPFVPLDGRSRDNGLELRLKALLDGELRIEPELERWYAVWGNPVTA